MEILKRAIGPLRSPVGHSMEWVGRMANSRVLKKYGTLIRANLEEYYLSRASTPFQYFNRTPSRIYSAEMTRRVNKLQSTSVARNLLSRKSGDGPLEKMLYVDTK